MNIWRWLLSLWTKYSYEGRQKRHAPPPRAFHSCEIVKSPPPNSEISPGRFIVVIPSNEPKWALFNCPCGCGHVITLSLASGRNPRWRVMLEDGRFPTLQPSVRQLDGCYSHFLVKSGRIIWCEDTGRRFIGNRHAH